MKKALWNFWSGLTCQHVDYATRHYSRAYDIGGSVAGAVLVLGPVATVFIVGFIIGRWTS